MTVSFLDGVLVGLFSGSILVLGLWILDLQHIIKGNRKTHEQLVQEYLEG